jgi:hypothetical protein
MHVLSVAPTVLCKCGLNVMYLHPLKPVYRSKAVANGALSWYIQNPVSARMNKFHYGVEISTLYDPSDEDMYGRSSYRDRRGDLKVEGVWGPIVSKVCSPQYGFDLFLCYVRMLSYAVVTSSISHTASRGVPIRSTSIIHLT